MRRQSTKAALLIAAAFFSASAQSTQPVTYSRSLYYKVDLDKREAFEKFLTNDVRKYHDVRVKDGLETRWALVRVLTDSSGGGDYNYISTAYSSKPLLQRENLEDHIRRSGGDPVEFRKNLATLAKTVRIVHGRSIDSLAPPSIKLGNIVVATRLRTTSSHMPEFRQLASDVVKPLMALAHKEGRLLNYSLNINLALAADSPWHFTALAVFPDVDSALRRDALGIANFTKALPARDYPSTMERFYATTSVVRTEILEIVAIDTAATNR